MPHVPPAARGRVALVQVLVVALLVTLSARLWYLQIHDGPDFQAAAAANDLRSVESPAVRGSILDDAGRPLVTNQAAYEAAAELGTLAQQPDGGRAELTRLAALLGVPAATLIDNARLCSPHVSQPCWTGSPYQPVPLQRGLDPRVAIELMEDADQYPGIDVEPAAQLQYPEPFGMQAAQILGYLAPVSQSQLNAPGSTFQPSDMVGGAGLEQTYDQALRGTPGIDEVSVDSVGRIVRTVSQTAPVPGDDLVTTLDARVQATAEQALAGAVKGARGAGYKADSGAVVVLNVNTGGIVAMATYPSYDPNVWTNGISAAEYAKLTSPAAGTPLLDRAYQGEFAPGSTFKLVTASAMLKDGFPPNGEYDCSPAFNIGSQSFHNFEGEAYGEITLKRAIEVSCDTVFYGAAYKMWTASGGITLRRGATDPVQDMALDYGFGEPTGLDLPGEAPGQIQTRALLQNLYDENKADWCEHAKTGYPDVAKTDPARAAYITEIAKDDCANGWEFLPGDAVIEAIGQGGILVTPLQLARAYAALANGGTLYQPHFEQALITPAGKVVATYQPKVVGHVPLSPAARAFLISCFEGVAQAGTAAGVYGPWPKNKIEVGAKTGTADVYGKQSTSVFASFLPADHPQYAIAMEVSQGGQGAITSGPAVEKIEAAMYGVQNGAVYPGGAILATPPSAPPSISPDGIITAPPGMNLNPVMPAPSASASGAAAGAGAHAAAASRTAGTAHSGGRSAAVPPPASAGPPPKVAPPGSPAAAASAHPASLFIPERRYADLFRNGALT